MSLTFPQTRPNNYCLIFLLVLCLASVIAALGIGRYGLSSAEVLRILWEGLAHKEGDPVLHQIVFNVRLPRILTCAAAGTVLGMCGCALQTIFRNPLVSPNVLGISSGASFGGTLAIFCDLSTWALYSSAIFFGLLTLTLVYFFSRKFREGLLMLILGGMVLNGFFTALVGLLQYLSDSEEKLPAIVFWLMGSFSSATMPKFFLFAIPVIVCGALMIGLRWRLNLLSLDEKNALSLGVRVQPLRWVFIVCCGVLISSQVAVSGNIGWVGLIVPHIGRSVAGEDTQVLLPACGLIGAIFLIGADTLARSISQAEIPISILTSLVGAPLFVLILLRFRKRRLNA